MIKYDYEAYDIIKYDYKEYDTIKYDLSRSALMFYPIIFR